MAVAVALMAMPPCLAAQTSSAADPREANLTAYQELLRSDVRTLKVAFLTELLQLTEREDEAFWPIYREYDRELSNINDERIALIREYSASYGTVTDAVAERLGQAAIDLDRRRTALLERYHKRVQAALSPRVALRFLQVEHQLLLLIDLQIAASLPIVK
jgi:hypothetical protein